MNSDFSDFIRFFPIFRLFPTFRLLDSTGLDSQCIPMSRNNCTDGDSKECPNNHPMPKFLYNLNPDQVAGWSFLFIQIY